MEALEPVMNTIIVTANTSPRAMSVDALETIAIKIFGHDRVFKSATLAEAIDRAIKDAVRPLSEETIAIVITGSVVTAGEARTIVRKRYAKESA